MLPITQEPEYISLVFVTHRNHTFAFHCFNQIRLWIPPPFKNAILHQMAENLVHFLPVVYRPESPA